jgi:hypothetical protein
MTDPAATTKTVVCANESAAATIRASCAKSADLTTTISSCATIPADILKLEFRVLTHSVF